VSADATARARPVAVLVTGAAPYLGGPATWAPLREAAPAVAFRDVDLLPTEADPAAIRAVLADAVRGADAVVAHGTAAGIALEAIAAGGRDVPALLLSPMLTLRRSPALRLVRALVAVPGFGALVTAAARSKLRRLRASRGEVEAQLRAFVAPEHITTALIEDACARLAGEHTARSVERTADVVRAVLAPVSPEAARVRRAVLVGDDALGRKVASRMPATVLRAATSAPMIEDPRAVAAALARLLEAAETVH
jgi:hypothetical protein